MSTFNSYLLAQQKSTTTATMVEKTVYRFCDWCEDQQIEAKHATYNEVLSFMRYLQQQGYKPRTIQMNVGHLSHYFKWLIHIGVRDTQPCKGIEVKGVQRRFLYQVIPFAELETLYNKFTGNSNYLSGTYQIWDKQSHFTTKTKQVVYGLMIWQGMEAGDLQRLTVSDLKLREGTIYIAGSRRTNERTLKLEALQVLDLMEYLQTIRPEYLRLNPNPTDKVFVSARGGEWGNNFLHLLFKSLTAFHPQLTNCNQLRASVITHWLKVHNLRTVQYMAGHRYVSSTESYLINDLDDLQADISRFHPLG